MVREAFPIDCKLLLTSILSDCRQARVVAKDIDDKVLDVGVKVEGVGDKVQCVDEKVQVVIDGERGLLGQFLNHSNIYIFRWQTSKSSGEGHK